MDLLSGVLSGVMFPPLGDFLTVDPDRDLAIPEPARVGTGIPDLRKTRITGNLISTDGYHKSGFNEQITHLTVLDVPAGLSEAGVTPALPDTWFGRSEVREPVRQSFTGP